MSWSTGIGKWSVQAVVALVIVALTAAVTSKKKD